VGILLTESPWRALWSSPLFCLCGRRTLLGSLHNIAHKRGGVSREFFEAWTLPTLLEYEVSTLAPWGIASKITVHTASLGGGAFLVWVCLPALDELRARVAC